MPVTARNAIATALNDAHDRLSSWRAVGAEFDISGGMAHRVAHGYEPKRPDIRSKLGLSSFIGVVMIDGGIIEGGAIIAFGSLTCAKRLCDVEFIPNTPIRKYCYYCSPIRSGKR